jgi:alpha-tubulin suppressor-like RCC1 family protein
MKDVGWTLGPMLAAGLLVTTVGCREDAQSPTEPQATPALATAASALAFYQVSGGGRHSCGVTTDNRAYCWGSNIWGQLGDGTATDRSRPVATTDGLRFHQISAGYTTTCGVTTDYRAYCWGYNGYAQLGDGTLETFRITPTPVAGGILFYQVEVGSTHSCGVSYPARRAYCWGENRSGELGDASTSSFRTTPVPVAGGLRFRQVSIGRNHTCGVTTDSKAFCWGANQYGQLGDRTEVPKRNSPALVADGHQFLLVDAGDFHNCGITTDNRAFCWGNGRNGQIGNGQKYLSFWPRAVAGGLRFDRLTGGSSHTCGETTLNQVYCWGSNYAGQLGDGTTTDRLTPVPVAGGLHFVQASAGTGHTCARTSDANGYCWGTNSSAELGDGTKTDRRKPTAVAGPM